MSCELVTYGIPLITSDLPICKEIFGKISNVVYIDNEIKNVNLAQVYRDVLSKKRLKIQLFDYENTVEKEEKLITMNQ